MFMNDPGFIIIKHLHKFISDNFSNGFDEKNSLLDLLDFHEPLEDKVGIILNHITNKLKERNLYHRREQDYMDDNINILKDKLDKATFEMEHDSLTNLFNRKALNEHLDRLLQLTNMSFQPAVLIMLDIDKFKSINDSKGHLVGDEVIKNVSSLLKTVFCRKTDFAARYGGDEFSIVLENTRMDSAILLSEKFRKIIECKFQEQQITVSQGLSEHQFDIDIHNWIQRADEKLYKSKREGRNRISF